MLLLLIFILLRKAKRAMVPNSMEANSKWRELRGEREIQRERERDRETERERGREEGREMINNFTVST